MASEQQAAKGMEEQFKKRFSRYIQKDDDQQTVLSHYTGLLSLMGMAESNELWMSKSTFLNDTHELVYFTEVMKAIIGELKSLPESPLRKLFIEELEGAAAAFNSQIDMEYAEVYTFSLAHSEDSLALWYNYAQGDGYNLGFFVSELVEQLRLPDEGPSILRGYVLYDREEQESFLLGLLQSAYEELRPHPLTLVKDILPPYFLSLISACAIFFKNPAFRNEEEYRIALLFEGDMAKPEVRFRAQNGIIIPYIALQFEQSLPIRHITIGPKNNIDVARHGIQQYLRSKGYPVEAIDIRKSVASLRY